MNSRNKKKREKREESVDKSQTQEFCHKLSRVNRRTEF